MTQMALHRATYRIGESELEYMVLNKEGIPADFQGYQVVREGILSNEEMAEHGFAGSTALRFREAGRITGYMREFGPTSDMSSADGFNFVGATVTHLFEDPDSVSRWMTDIFVKDFEEHVGESVGEDQQVISVQRLEPNGLFDEAVALKVLQGGPVGLISSTVIDFRVGRILGVAFVGTVGDHERIDLATQLAGTLEKNIVRVVLGGM